MPIAHNRGVATISLSLSPELTQVSNYEDRANWKMDTPAHARVIAAFSACLPWQTKALPIGGPFVDPGDLAGPSGGTAMEDDDDEKNDGDDDDVHPSTVQIHCHSYRPAKRKSREQPAAEFQQSIHEQLEHIHQWNRYTRQDDNQRWDQQTQWHTTDQTHWGMQQDWHAFEVANWVDQHEWNDNTSRLNQSNWQRQHAFDAQMQQDQAAFWNAQIDRDTNQNRHLEELTRIQQEQGATLNEVLQMMRHLNPGYVPPYPCHLRRLSKS